MSLLRLDSLDDLHQLASKLISVVNPDIDGGPTITYASGAWVRYPSFTDPSFKQVAEDIYKAVFEDVHFNNVDQVIKKVNKWAKEHTNGHIKEILGQSSIKKISEDTMILANALYFKARWRDTFLSWSTRDRNFTRLDGSLVTVPFMAVLEDDHGSRPIVAHHGFKVLGLPYASSQSPSSNMCEGLRRSSASNRSCEHQFSMYIFLPDDKDGLLALWEKVSSEPDFVSKHLPVEYVKVGKLVLPKFKFSSEIEVSKHLNEIFSLDLEKDMIHKSLIEVSEKGTEATGISIMASNELQPVFGDVPVDFVADHPFLFLVRDDTTGVVLFMGHVADPSAN